MEKKFQRIPHEGAIAGVCAGLGRYFGIDKTWVRLVFIISVFFSGYMGIGLLGPIVYIILWIVLPVKSFVLPRDPFDVDYRAPEDNPAAGSGYNPYAWEAEATPKPPAQRVSNDRYIAGMIFLALGLFFLLHQLDVFHWRDIGRYWPVLIIILGLATVFGAFNKRRPSAPPVREAHRQTAEPEPGQTAGNPGEEDPYTK